uniref:8.9 kDa family member n=1 Tax=Rhipicephalus appendiculatus TaxID=34631 RepID=A0A131YMV0_RHIAP
MKILVVIILAVQGIVMAYAFQCIARADLQAGCQFGPIRIPLGRTVTLRDPCVRVRCPGHGLKLEVDGCPFRGGSNPHPGAPSRFNHLAYPFCCDSCNAVFV